MIIKVNILSCSYCGSKNLVKNGFDSNNGKQLYKCKDYNGYGRENPQNSKYSDEAKELIIGCYWEGMVTVHTPWQPTGFCRVSTADKVAPKCVFSTDCALKPAKGCWLSGGEVNDYKG